MRRGVSIGAGVLLKGGAPDDTPEGGITTCWVGRSTLAQDLSL